MHVVRRPAVRVLCLDHRDRLLLLRWRDPAESRYIWEPPGGGIEPGERPVDAARRELWEETGLPTDTITDRHVMVPRDFRWNGKQYVGEEAFFLTRFEGAQVLSRDGLEDQEAESLQDHAWVQWQDIDQLPEEVEPPGILPILRAIDPAGPWNSR